MSSNGIDPHALTDIGDQDGVQGGPPHLSDSALDDSQVERFVPGNFLGAGATGEVWAVHDRNLNRSLAIKVLHRNLEADGEIRASFLAEARLIAGLNHPGIPTVHDLQRTLDQRLCFSMPRVEGKTLGAVLEDSSLGHRHPLLPSAHAVAAMLIQVCNAVAVAHHQGIVHQDIKPDNLLLGSFGEVLVLDWGSAASLSAGRKASDHVYGTPLFMSPEQARSEGADRRSDVYALGGTLFSGLLLRSPIDSRGGEQDF